MADVNTIMLCGRVGKSPDLRQTGTGKKVATLSVATNRSVRTASGDWDEVAEWHRVVCWEQLADRAMGIDTGDKVFVSGQLRYSRWTDSGGAKRFGCEVVASKLDLLLKKLDVPKPESSAPPVEAVDEVGDEVNIPF